MLLLNLLLVPVGAVLWYLGGYGYGNDGIPDPDLKPDFGKNWRRIVWPVFAALVASANGVSNLGAVALAGTMWAALTLGYGDTHSWGERVMVGALYGIPALLLDCNIVYPLVTTLTFVPLFMLSLRHNWMTWPVVEAAMGAVQGACLLAALMIRCGGL